MAEFATSFSDNTHTGNKYKSYNTSSRKQDYLYSFAVTEYRFGDGSRKGSISYKSFSGKRRTHDTGDIKGRCYQRESVNRTRKRIEEISRENNLVRLITFSNGGKNGGWKSPKDALDSFSLFYKCHAAKVSLGSIVAVVERGDKAGRIHIHAITQRGYIRRGELGIRWSRLLDGRGYHSPSGSHTVHVGRARTSIERAEYVCKNLLQLTEDKSMRKYRKYRAYNVRYPKPHKRTIRARDVYEAYEISGIGLPVTTYISEAGNPFCITFDSERPGGDYHVFS
ncbi:MAG: hypothetical protein FWE26_04095 [Coriobacteriia bacterium]|nr:hypothetical protein [Coriobacteriia bacterium]MCL2870793.1 hypothetical protein [Coriobacteriia bacterium]